MLIAAALAVAVSCSSPHIADGDTITCAGQRDALAWHTGSQMQRYPAQSPHARWDQRVADIGPLNQDSSASSESSKGLRPCTSRIDGPRRGAHHYR